MCKSTHISTHICLFHCSSTPVFSVCVFVCVLYGGSFDKVARQGLSNAIFKFSSMYLFHCSSTPVSAVCACVYPFGAHGSFDSKVWVILSFKSSSLYLFHSRSPPVFGWCVCVLYGGSFDEEAWPGLSKAKFKSQHTLIAMLVLLQFYSSLWFVCVLY